MSNKESRNKYLVNPGTNKCFPNLKFLLVNIPFKYTYENHNVCIPNKQKLCINLRLFPVLETIYTAFSESLSK